MANCESDNIDILTGLTERHLVPIDFLEDGQSAARKSNILVHQHVLRPFSLLRSAAANEGFDLRICSGFRSFQRQRLIWNEKLSGLRPVLIITENQLFWINYLTGKNFKRCLDGLHCPDLLGTIGGLILMFMMQALCQKITK